MLRKFIDERPLKFSFGTSLKNKFVRRYLLRARRPNRGFAGTGTIAKLFLPENYNTLKKLNKIFSPIFLDKIQLLHQVQTTSSISNSSWLHFLTKKFQNAKIYQQKKILKISGIFLYMLLFKPVLFFNYFFNYNKKYRLKKKQSIFWVKNFSQSLISYKKS